MISSLFDGIRLFAQFNVHKRQFLKNFWTRNGCNIRKNKFATSTEQRTKPNSMCLFVDASVRTVCAVADLRCQLEEYTGDQTFVFGIWRIAPTIRIAGCSHVREI